MITPRPTGRLSHRKALIQALNPPRGALSGAARHLEHVGELDRGRNPRHQLRKQRGRVPIVTAGCFCVGAPLLRAHRHRDSCHQHRYHEATWGAQSTPECQMVHAAGSLAKDPARSTLVRARDLEIDSNPEQATRLLGAAGVPSS